MARTLGYAVLVKNFESVVAATFVASWDDCYSDFRSSVADPAGLVAIGALEFHYFKKSSEASLACQSSGTTSGSVVRFGGAFAIVEDVFLRADLGEIVSRIPFFAVVYLVDLLDFSAATGSLGSSAMKAALAVFAGG